MLNFLLVLGQPLELLATDTKFQASGIISSTAGGFKLPSYTNSLLPAVGDTNTCRWQSDAGSGYVDGIVCDTGYGKDVSIIGNTVPVDYLCASAASYTARTCLSDAVTALGSTNQHTILIPNPQTISANLTITSNLTLVFQGSGRLDPATGTTTTIVGNIIAPPGMKIFGGTGTVTANSASKTEVFHVGWWGAVGDDSTDDQAAIQAAINAAVNSANGEIRLLPLTYKVLSSLSIANAGEVRLNMPAGGEIHYDGSANSFAIVLENCISCKLFVAIDSEDNGIQIKASASGGAQSVRNEIRGRIFGNGKAGTKPALGSGSVGIEFDNPGVLSNYYNTVDTVHLRGFDTLIRMESEANGQTIIAPQLEQYWYGIDFSSQENNLLGGWASQATGVDASNLVEAFHLGATSQWNTLRDFIIETGSFSRAGVIESGAINNVVDVQDNTSYGISNSGSGSFGADSARIWKYDYNSLNANTYYRLNKIPTISNRHYIATIHYESFNTTTNGTSSGVSIASVSNAAGTVTVTPIYHTSKTASDGVAVLAGWDIVSADAYPNFQITGSSGTATVFTDISITDYTVFPRRHSASTVAPGSATTPVITVTNDGKVGISKTSPGAKFEVDGSALLANNNPLQWRGSGGSAKNVVNLDGSDFLNLTSSGTSSNGIITFGTGNGTEKARIDAGGHWVSKGTSPAVSACGTTPAITGNDIAGKVTIGGGGAVTSCTVTFVTPYNTNAPACTVSGDNTGIVYIATTTTTVLTISIPPAADMQSDVVSYICLGME